MSVTLERIEDNFALLQVNRPQVRNALDWRAMEDFSNCIEQARQLEDLHALILSGKGSSFIAGGDLKALQNYASQDDAVRLMRLMGSALNRLEALPYPTIAAINGPARGGGAEIALVCDMRVMSENADLGFVQIAMGLTPGWGAGRRLLHLVGYSSAMEMLMTGKVLSAEEARALGLVNRVVAPGQAKSGALDLAREISRMPQTAVKAVKRLLRGAVLLHTGAAEALERSEFPPLWEAEEHLNAVERFLNRKGDQ